MDSKNFLHKNYIYGTIKYKVFKIIYIYITVLKQEVDCDGPISRLVEACLYTLMGYWLWINKMYVALKSIVMQRML
jgi:hypothetical protein